MSKLKYVCPMCRGGNITFPAWVNPNTKEIGGDYNGDGWCSDCETHIEYMDKSHPRDYKK